jgi:hypothetical protein
MTDETLTLGEVATTHYGEPATVKWSAEKEAFFVEFEDGSTATFDSSLKHAGNVLGRFGPREGNDGV